MITITESAQEYLAALLKKQDCDGIAVRIFILDAGTPKAETCISYIEARSIPYLKDAVVDYAKDAMGGQLTIKAPNSRLPQITDDSTLEDRVNYVLYNEVNPSLAAHGGVVTLEEIFDNSIAILKFGGGCQGCGMVDLTLKEGVEKTLLEQIPQLTEVRDITDHSQRENAYFK